MSSASDSLAPSPATDCVVRAMTNDGAFRVIGIVSTATAQATVARQHAVGDVAVRLAELLTAAVLIRETTQPARRVQVVWTDNDGQMLVADALADGKNRGIVSPGRGGDDGVAGHGARNGDNTLQVSYTLRNGSLHQSMIAVPQGQDMSAALMRYMQESEQTVCIAQLCALPAGVSAPGNGAPAVRAVGGYLVQLLPEATVEVIAEMTDKVSALPALTHWLENAQDARGVVATLLDGFEYTELAASDIAFGCTCSEERFIMGILTLQTTDLEEILNDPIIEVSCDACGQQYHIAAETVREMQVAGKRRYEA